LKGISAEGCGHTGLTGQRSWIKIGGEALGQLHSGKQLGVLAEDLLCGVLAAWHGAKYTVPAARLKSTLN
jgi:hypothetical protein